MRSYGISQMSKSRKKPSARAFNKGPIEYDGLKTSYVPPPAKPYNYSSEARQAPTSNHHRFVFPWNPDSNRFEVSSELDLSPAEGRITRANINSVLKDLHGIQYFTHEKKNPILYLGMATGILGLLMLLVNVLWGSLTTKYQYEIKEESDRRYIDFEPIVTPGRTLETIFVSLAVLFVGLAGFLMTFCCAVDADERRLKRRLFIIHKLLKKHQESTFAGTGCSITCSEFGAYITITMGWKVPPPAPQPESGNIPADGTAKVVPSQKVQGSNDQSTAQLMHDSLADKLQPLPEMAEAPNVPPVKDHPEDVSIRIPEEQPL